MAPLPEFSQSRRPLVKNIRKLLFQRPAALSIATVIVLILAAPFVGLELAKSNSSSQSGTNMARPERVFKRSIRGDSRHELPDQLKKFRDGLRSNHLTRAQLLKLLASVPAMSEEQANTIIDGTDHELLAKYLGGLSANERADGSNNKLLYNLLANRLIADDPMTGIDIIKQMGHGLNSCHYSELLTKAALDPTGELASKISNDLISSTSWPGRIDGGLFASLLGAGLPIDEAVAKIEALPGGKSLAAAAISQYYLMGYGAPKPNELERKFLLEYSRKSDFVSLHCETFHNLLKD